MIFLIMVLVILVFVVLWNFDLNKIIHVKSITQNGGDAAAIAAARWQGISLNLIGDLNILHALAIEAGNSAAESSITNIQARLCFVGPMIGLMAAQQAAKNNGIYVNPDFSEWLTDHASEVRNTYPTAIGPSGDPLFPEPYDGCWLEYADMLDLIASDGVAAGPDNMRLFSDFANGGHYLLMMGFYEAVAGRGWCWFYNNAPSLLEDYQNFFPCWWDPLPEIPRTQYINSEIFSLGLSKVTTTLSEMTDAGTISTLAQERQLGTPTGNSMTNISTWYCYGSEFWAPWTAISPAAPNYFPVTGTLKPEYDYAGADAVLRVETSSDMITPGPGGAPLAHDIIWSAAAKPFGYLNENDRPNMYSIVLPAYKEVALIPVDTASSSSGGGYNLAWRRHIEEHLTVYMENGPDPSSACWYCRQLVTWENDAFRNDGVVWLSSNSWRCTISSGGGPGGPGGGSRRGH